MQKLSLWQRLMADTPKFERVIQVIALVLSLVFDHLAQSGFIPHNVVLVLDGALGGIAFIAQFAYEQQAEIKTIIADPGKALDMIPDLIEQFGQLKQAVTNPPVVTLPAIEQAAAPLFQAPVTPVSESTPAPGPSFNFQP